MIGVRTEAPGDAEAIGAVHREAFGQALEADIVVKLRDAGQLTVSLVALSRSDIVGHVAFSPVSILPDDGGRRALGLGPLAVRPADQRKGIGSELVKAGLARAGAEGWELVFVLGEPPYYRQFGFRAASDAGLAWEVGGPLPAFMAIELRPGMLSGVHGVVRYHPAFKVG